MVEGGKLTPQYEMTHWSTFFLGQSILTWVLRWDLSVIMGRPLVNCVSCQPTVVKKIVDVSFNQGPCKSQATAGNEYRRFDTSTFRTGCSPADRAISLHMRRQTNFGTNGVISPLVGLIVLVPSSGVPMVLLGGWPVMKKL